MTMTPYMLQRQQMKLKRKSATDIVDADKEMNSKDKRQKKAPISGKSSTHKKRIKKVSKKRAKQQRQYTPIRRKFLKDHPTCQLQLDGCTGIASEVHHAAGRENGRLLNVEDFKAACHNCHSIATEKSRKAIASGHSKTRLGKPQK